ncbi:MAG: A/G-specific adenine glycosylase [Bacteroidota bacterium]|nr:A/G-specific adenine glycosylase [Bacteroidota bacterium]
MVQAIYDINLSDKLIKWFFSNKRDLPWRKTKEPYSVWVSEIILQQTRIETGIKYYYSFIKKYPNVKLLAKSNKQQLLKTWEGLGYYSRALNMHKAAKQVLLNHGGVFPKDYQSLINLPGVGDYTASAISSICNNEKEAVVDGNVLRFISRLLKIDEPINSLKTKKQIKKYLNKKISPKNPGDFNEAIMDFGSTVCKAKKFLCQSCIFSLDCQAHLSSTVKNYPIKSNKIKPVKKEMNYVIIISDDKKIYLNKRTDKGIWKNLFEFFLVKGDPMPITKSMIVKSLSKKFNFDSNKFRLHKSIVHKLSHMDLKINFYMIEVKNYKTKMYDFGSLNEIPFPKPLKVIIDDFV